LKLGLSLAGVNINLKNLREADIVIPHDFKVELVEQGKEIKNKAKEILERESSTRTNKQYWTGKLQEAIKLHIGEAVSYGYEPGPGFKPETGKTLTISIGPDMRMAPYAEWVEIGHYKTGGEWGAQRGGWWEGYHYLEGAYTELAPKIPVQIAKTVTIALNKFARTANQRTRHSRTQQFTKGFAGMKGAGA